MNYEKIKKEIIKLQRALRSEIAHDKWETNIDEMYNLFEEHKENIMTNYPKGLDRNIELSSLMSKKIEFTMKFSNGLYKDFMVIKLHRDLKPSPCIIPPNVTELIIMPSDGPIKTRLTEIPPNLFASKMLGSDGNTSWETTSSGFEDTTVRIAPGITEIGDHAFSNLRFNKIYLPNTLERIRNGAFEKCTFSTVHIPPSVKYIGSNAFAENDYLTSVTGMKGVTIIKNTPFNKTKIDFIEIWKPFSEIDYESGSSTTPFDMFYGTRFNQNPYQDDSDIYTELYEATVKRQYYFEVLEKYTGTKLECGKNTPDDIKFCLLNIPPKSHIGGAFTEIIKFLGCRVLGYLKPDTLEEMSRLYAIGIRCFDFPTRVQPDIINELNTLVDGSKNNWGTWDSDSDDSDTESDWGSHDEMSNNLRKAGVGLGEDGLIAVFGKLEPIHIIGFYKWTRHIMHLFSPHFKVIIDDDDIVKRIGFDIHPWSSSHYPWSSSHF